MKPQDIERMNAFFEENSYDDEPKDPLASAAADIDPDDEEVAVVAAGVIILAPDGTILLLKRSDAGDHPGEWCIPGGKVERGESARQAAVREVLEETGIELHEDVLEDCHEAVSDEAVHFTTFLCEVPESTDPTLDEEHTEFMWHPIADPLPEDSHPGVAAAIAACDELEDVQET